MAMPPDIVIVGRLVQWNILRVCAEGRISYASTLAVSSCVRMVGRGVL